VLGGVWGASFLFIRVGAPALGPFVLMGARVVIAAVALLLWALARRERLELRRRWRRYLLQGLLGAAVPFAFIAIAEVRLSASLGAILNSTSPLFSVLVGRVWLGHPLRGRQVVGAIIGIVGVALLVGIDEISVDSQFVVAVALSLLAALSYGVAANYAKLNLADTGTLEVSVGQLIGAAIWLTPLALVTLPSARLAPDAVAALVGLTLLSTTFAYLIYFRLIARAGATRAIAVTFLIPLFGVALGALVLGEPIRAGLITGLVTILVGVALVLEIGRREPVASATAAE
jgi:drug/metabolite transporter (DMT)-like permease